LSSLRGVETPMKPVFVSVLSTTRGSVTWTPP
jgi:hypothetical protein